MDLVAGTGSGRATDAPAGATALRARQDAPSQCYLCGAGQLELKYPARGASSESDPGSEAYRCTSFGHGTHPDIWRCRSCGMLFQWPIRDEAELIEAYRLVEDPTYEAERDARYYTFQNVLRALGPGEGRSLLDVGAYCGYFLDVARQGGFSAEGLELSKWASDRARSLGFVVHAETVAERAASGQRYDAVTMWDVIEHVTDPRAELQSAFRLIEPGGTLHLSTIDAGSLVARGMGRRWPWLMDMHLYYFDRSTMTSLLHEVGFQNVSIGNYTHYVSMRYLLAKVESLAGPLAPVAATTARVVPGAWRVPVNLGDNMLVRAVRPA